MTLIRIYTWDMSVSQIYVRYVLIPNIRKIAPRPTYTWDTSLFKMYASTQIYLVTNIRWYVLVLKIRKMWPYVIERRGHLICIWDKVISHTYLAYFRDKDISHIYFILGYISRIFGSRKDLSYIYITYRAYIFWQWTDRDR